MMLCMRVCVCVCGARHNERLLIDVYDAYRKDFLIACTAVSCEIARYVYAVVVVFLFGRLMARDN